MTGIAGSHIRSFNSIGMVAIKDKEVTEADVLRVTETAKAVNIPTDQQMLHVLPQEFIIDGQEDIREPVGMSGVRLDVKVHIVTGAVSAVQNIIKCVRRCGLEVQDLILQPIASSSCGADGRRKGTRRGRWSTSAAAPPTSRSSSAARSGIRRCSPIAGDQITNDIAMALRTPTADAEDIKLRHGLAKQVLANPNDKIEVPGIGDRGPRSLSSQALAAVIEPRVEELFSMVQQTIRESGYEEALSSGDRDHRRLEPAAGHGRAGRRHLPQAGARGRAGLRRSAGRCGADAEICHRDGSARGSAPDPPAGAQGCGAIGFLQGHDASHEGVVPWEFLTCAGRFVLDVKTSAA